MEIDGAWRTIRGHRVFIKTGQSLSDAMRESGKFRNNDIEIAKKIDELYQRKMNLEQKKAEMEIKEDLSKPIEKSNKENIEERFDENNYSKIDDNEFNELGNKQNITIEEENILYDANQGFIGTDYAMGINNCLRDETIEMNFQQRKVRDTLNNVISKNKIDFDIKATRYVNSDYLENTFGIGISREQRLEEFKNAEKIVNENVGKVVPNKGFMSVSLTDRNIFKDSVVKMNTYIKKGTNMFVTKNIDESEAILKSLTKYKIIKAYNVVDEYGYNQLNIDIEVLK